MPSAKPRVQQLYHSAVFLHADWNTSTVISPRQIHQQWVRREPEVGIHDGPKLPSPGKEQRGVQRRVRCCIHISDAERTDGFASPSRFTWP